MSGPERREAILTAAGRVFGSRSYAAATTAMIAREAGITEPVLYHHFGNKAVLYQACLTAAWDEVRGRWNEILVREPNPARWIERMAESGLSALDDEHGAGRLWVHAMTEVAEDPKARPFVVEFVRELHEYVAQAHIRAQQAGGMPESLDPRAEAWVFLSLGILRALSTRLDGMVEPDFPQILAARHRWFALA